MTLLNELKNNEVVLQELQEEKAKFMGKLEQLKNDLKAKFSIDNIEAAEKLLVEKNKELETLTVEGDALLAKITGAVEKAKAKNDV